MPRRRMPRHSGREAGIQGRDSNLAVTTGAKVARPLTLPGLGPGFPAGTTNHPHQNLAPARFFYVWAILFRARSRPGRGWRWCGSS